MNTEDLVRLAALYPANQRRVTIAIGGTEQLLSPNPMRWSWLIVPDLTSSLRIAMSKEILTNGGLTIPSGTSGFFMKVSDSPGMTTQEWFGFNPGAAPLNVTVIETVPYE